MTRGSEKETAEQHSESRIPSTAPELPPPDAEETTTPTPQHPDGVLLASALVMACGIGLFVTAFFAPGDPGVFLLIASSIVFFAGVMMFAREVWVRHACDGREHETTPEFPTRPARLTRAGGIALTIVGVLILVIVVLLAVVLYFAAQFDDSGAPGDPLLTLFTIGFFVFLVVLGIAAIVVGKRQRRKPEMRGSDNPAPGNPERPAVHWFWPDR